LICCKTTIGFGSPNLAGTHDCHGAPLGNEEIAATRKQLGWDHAAFEIPAWQITRHTPLKLGCFCWKFCLISRKFIIPSAFVCRTLCFVVPAFRMTFRFRF
jgi:hypothetical protein